jgi:acyl carrier protein
MSLEKEFQLDISDNAKESFVTPKAIIDYLFSQVQDKFAREQVAEKIWEILVYETGINRSKFDENSLFIADMGID